MRISDWSSDVCSSDLFEQFARVPVDLDVASEFRYRAPVMEDGGLALFISQSGETADTLAALRHARSEGQRIAVVVNVPTSTMAREADLLLHPPARRREEGRVGKEGGMPFRDRWARDNQKK